MTTSLDSQRYELALERWRELAERRLAHLTELYESGRWHRYFSEERFLRMIRETKAATELWQRLAPGQAPASHVFTMPIPYEQGFVRTQPPPTTYEFDAPSAG